jgi:hypothetical protein
MTTRQLHEIEADHCDRAVPGLMRASDVAAILGISVKTVNRLVRERAQGCRRGLRLAPRLFKLSHTRDVQWSTLAIEKPGRERHGHV